eukprot:6475656-Amphidinium_carterae.1
MPYQAKWLSRLSQGFCKAFPVGPFQGGPLQGLFQAFFKLAGYFVSIVSGLRMGGPLGLARQDLKCTNSVLRTSTGDSQGFFRFAGLFQGLFRRVFQR